MRIIFEAHATTFDNEAGVCSGWNDVALSKTGRGQARAMAERYKPEQFDAIFCPDLQRGYATVQLAFPGIAPSKLFFDWRLRECDYGDLTLQPREIVEAKKADYISQPFPGGESYEQAMQRMKSFIDDLRVSGFKNVLIVGSRATHYGLDHWINGISLGELVATKFAWQPGWKFELE